MSDLELPTAISVNSNRSRVDLSSNMKAVDVSSGKTRINVSIGIPPGTEVTTTVLFLNETVTFLGQDLTFDP